MRIPEFYIVGAPKCGTTTLRTALNNHPDIFIPSPVEPQYFASDLHPDSVDKDLDWYLTKFYSATDAQQKIWGDKSTWYLYSTVAIARILSINPSAKFIALVRDPTDLFLSLHANYCFHGMEDEYNPSKAWDLQYERRKGNQIPKTLKASPEMLAYENVCALGNQLTRLQTQVSRQQLKVIHMNDLADGGATLSDIQRFLGLPKILPLDITRENQRKPAVPPVINRLLTPSSNTVRAGKWAKDLLGIKSLGIGQRMNKARIAAGRAFGRKLIVDPKFRQELDTYFESDRIEIGRALNNSKA